MPSNPGIIVSVQYLRGFAAVAVALAHITSHSHLAFEIGAAGVDVFFVISGFIMWQITSKRTFRPGEFLVNRITRIAPPYALLTIAVYLTATYVPGAFPNMRTSLPHAVMSLLFIPHIDHFGTAYPQIAPGWTLNYEVFFYFVFAMSLLAPAGVRIRICTGALVVLALIGLMTDSSFAAVNTYTSPLLLEFVAGLWLGVAWNKNWLPRAFWGWAAILAGLVGLAAWELQQGMQPADLRPLVWGLPALLIVGGLLTIERRVGMAHSRLALLLGNASFSIYLVNVFVVAAIWRMLSPISIPGYFVAAAIGSVAAGIVFWRVVEQPTIGLCRTWIRRPPSFVATAWPAALRTDGRK